MLVGHRDGVLAPERRLPGEHLEQDDAGRIQVGSRVDALAARLLWGEVLGRSHDRAGLGDRRRGLRDRPRDSEIHDLHLAVGGDHDVARLDVAVHDPGTVRILERRQDLCGDARGLVLRQRALGDDVFEKPAIHVFHDDEGDLRLIALRVEDGLLAGVEDAHDGGMRHLGGILCLTAKAGAEGGVAREGRFEQLDGDASTEAGVRSEPDVGHAATSDQCANLVSAGEQAHALIHAVCHDPSPVSRPRMPRRVYPVDLGQPSVVRMTPIRGSSEATDPSRSQDSGSATRASGRPRARCRTPRCKLRQSSPSCRP